MNLNLVTLSAAHVPMKPDERKSKGLDEVSSAMQLQEFS